MTMKTTHTNQTTQMKQGGTKQILKHSIKPFLVGGIATAAASHWMKGSKSTKMKRKIEQAKTQATQMAKNNSMLENIKENPISETVKQNMDSDKPIAQAFKENLSGDQNQQSKNNNQPSNNLGPNQNQNQNQNHTNQPSAQNNRQGNNQSKSVETGGF